MSEPVLNQKTAAQMFDDLLMRIAVSSYMEIEGQRLLERQKELDRDGLFQPTEVEKKKVLRIIRRCQLKRDLQTTGKRIFRVSRALPVLFVLCFVVFGSSMAVSASFRDVVYRLIFQNEQQYTLIRIDPLTKNNAVEDIFTWENAYAPYKLPAGYQISEVRELKDSNVVVYQSDGGKEIVFWQFNNDNLQIDTEKADYIQRITIQDSDALLVLKNGQVALCWMQKSYVLYIRTQESVETTIAIAQSVYPVIDH